MNKIDFVYPNDYSISIALNENDKMNLVKDYVYNRFDQDVSIHHAEINLNGEFARLWP